MNIKHLSCVLVAAGLLPACMLEAEEESTEISSVSQPLIY